jgi:hypothetical protein
MKNTRSRLALVIGHSSLVISSTAFLAADDAALRPIAFQNGVNQQSLGAETAELARTINALIDELQRNGFPVQSLNVITEHAAQLNSLGGTEMTAIASRLRRLGENAQADPRATATEAYLAQQAIETRLKTLARQISIQQLREEAARRLEALITRQLAIQRETRGIATAKANAERQRILESDQSGIGEDLATFFQTGENLLARLREGDAPVAKPAATSATAPTASAGPTFAERINGTYLTTLSTEAVDHLKGKRYPDAYGRQEALIAELRKILQGILSSLPKEQRLASALQQVAALRQQEESRAQNKTETPESKQAAADQAKNLASQVAPLSPEAAEALNQAAKETKTDTSTPPDQKSASKDQDKDKSKDQSKDQAKDQSKSQQASTSESGKKSDTPNDEQPPATPPDSQPETPSSAAAKSLAAAESALQKALTQAQNEAAKGQNQPGPNTPQQAQNGQPTPGQQTQGQQKPGPGQGQQPPQPNQQGQGEQTAQAGQSNQPPGTNQRQTSSGGGTGDAQDQITGHGPNSGDPAQVVGALRREEREAFNALQNERYPAEYSAWVQQYWRSLAQDQ